MQKRNLNIQCLRGICALVVFFSHALNIYNISWVQDLMSTPWHFFFDGQWAVVVFFALSGYYYYTERELTFSSYLKGLKKKALKIYPPHLIILGIGCILIMCYTSHDIFPNRDRVTKWAAQFWMQPVGIKELIGNATVLLPHNFDAINPPSWYLMAEVKMFIVMPLFVALVKRTSWVLAFAVFLVCWLVEIPFVSCIGSYVAGALLHKYINRIEISAKFYIFILAVGVVLLDIRNFGISFMSHSNNTCVLMTQCIGALCILYVCNSLRKDISSKVLLYFGNISYEFYITHFIVLMGLAPWIINPTSLIIVSFILTVCIAHILNIGTRKIIEKL